MVKRSSKRPKGLESAIAVVNADLVGYQKPPIAAEDAIGAEQSATLATLSAIRQRLDARLRDQGLVKGLTSDAANVARALAALGAEVRKRETHVKDAVARMTVAEQVELVCQFIDELPAAQRAVVKAHMERS